MNMKLIFSKLTANNNKNDPETQAYFAGCKDFEKFLENLMETLIWF